MRALAVVVWGRRNDGIALKEQATAVRLAKVPNHKDGAVAGKLPMFSIILEFMAIRMGRGQVDAAADVKRCNLRAQRGETGCGACRYVPYC